MTLTEKPEASAAPAVVTAPVRRPSWGWAQWLAVLGLPILFVEAWTPGLADRRFGSNPDKPGY